MYFLIEKHDSKVSPPNVEVNLDEAIELKCQSQSQNNKTLWFHNNVNELPKNSEPISMDRVLRIAPALSSSNGFYFCYGHTHFWAAASVTVFGESSQI